MTCTTYGEMSASLLDDALTPREQRVLEAHLAQCVECAEGHVDLTELQQLLDASRAAPPPDQLARLTDRIERDAAARPLFHQTWQAVTAILPAPRPIRTGAVGAALLAVAVLLWPAPPPPIEPPPMAEPEATHALFTVWDDEAARIVAAVDPLGQTDWESFEVADADLAHGPVRIHLVETIDALR